MADNGFGGGEPCKCTQTESSAQPWGFEMTSVFWSLPFPVVTVELCLPPPLSKQGAGGETEQRAGRETLTLFSSSSSSTLSVAS